MGRIEQDIRVEVGHRSVDAVPFEAIADSAGEKT
jgi:hypothetical protein